MMTLKRLPSPLAILGMLFVLHTNTAAADERISTLQDQTQLAVTIYNQDLALIKDSRNVALERGENALAWRDVSARMQPETALLRHTTQPGSFRLLEQNFDFDLLTPQKLLEKHVGRTVRVIKTNPATGAETSEAATVLAANGGTVLQFADRIESHPAGRLAYQMLPDNLRAQPTLVIRLDAADAGRQSLELAYLTAGLSWKADYVGELSSDEKQLDLNGWVTLTNQSGASYPNARLQLVAGDVNRVRAAMPRMAMKALPMAAAAETDFMQEENLFEYHLYTFDRPTSIANNQTKQVALLSAPQVNIRKEYRLLGEPYYYHDVQSDMARKLKVGTFMEFDNKGQSLGIPLPKGTLRIYKRDSNGNAQFIGEDSIDHTPKNEAVRIKLGNAFDLTADRKQTDFKRIAASGRGSYGIVESAFEITLKNAKNEAVTIDVLEPIPGDWSVTEENLPHSKASANQARWRVPVPAQGSKTLTYRVKVRL